MRLKLFTKSREAFTRVELLVVLTGIGLLGTLVLSVLGSTAARSDSAVCANNLRQIGRAFHMWASDHGGQNPWWVHYSEGGSYIPLSGPSPPGGLLNVPGFGPLPAALRNNTWFQFGYVGLELQNPAVLVCPADRSKVRARAFSSNSTNGFFAPSFQNRANSYLIGAHAMLQTPSSLLSGDRALKADFSNASCTANVGAVSGLSLVSPPPGWTSDLHPDGGNLLGNDGRVEFLSGTGLRSYLGEGSEENGSLHFLKPN